MKRASGMLLFLCSFYITNAQLYIGTGGSLTVKDSTLFQTERKISPAPLYVENSTTVHNLEQISNIKMVAISSPTLQKSSQTSLAKTIRKPKNRKTEKKAALKLISKQTVYISENKNSVIVSNEKSGNIAIIINAFDEKQGVLQNKYKMFAVYGNKIFPKQSLKSGLFERTFLLGIQIRPPPSFKYNRYI